MDAAARRAVARRIANGAPVARPIAVSRAVRRGWDSMAPVRGAEDYTAVQAVVGERQPLDQDRHERAVEAVPAGVRGMGEVVHADA